MCPSFGILYAFVDPVEADVEYKHTFKTTQRKYALKREQVSIKMN